MVTKGLLTFDPLFRNPMAAPTASDRQLHRAPSARSIARMMTDRRDHLAD
jgi:hypothetical protein